MILKIWRNELYIDFRIVKAIESVILFDDINLCKIKVLDAGSSNRGLFKIKKTLRQEDELIVKPDKGVFDALNNGINNAK